MRDRRISPRPYYRQSAEREAWALTMLLSAFVGGIIGAAITLGVLG